MPRITTLGGMSSRGLGQFAQTGEKLYVEDVFSTYLYTGNGSSQTITNGIDLAGKGGLVWIKNRDTAGYNNYLASTAQTLGTNLISDSSNANTLSANAITSYNANGFSLGGYILVNANSKSQVSWTFRKAPKFFDVVTWSGNGVNRTIAHSLGSVPGMIIVKRTDTTGDWQVYHRSLANTEYMVLNTTAAKATGTTRWNSTTPTATEFSLGTDATVNANNGTYVAYLFAHDAGGFGDAGDQSIIKCGSFTGQGQVDLGWEPQFLLVKPYSQDWNWSISDSMRGMSVSNPSSDLFPNTTGAEQSGGLKLYINSTGFDQQTFGSTYPCIYIAIRRGPMRTPTDATKVYNAITRTGTSAAATVTGIGFPPDLATIKDRKTGVVAAGQAFWSDRLRGPQRFLLSNGTNSEGTDSNGVTALTNNSAVLGSDSNGYINFNGANYINYFFGRAPGFFDIVCYTGNSISVLVNQTINHNLGVVPELIIVKGRSSTDAGWVVGYNFTASQFDNGYLYATNASNPIGYNVAVFGAQPTATTFTVLNQTASGTYVNNTNYIGNTYVAYLFASCPGVSKVGNYTGTGATQTINCGFTGGARYVLIKRINSTGDWWVWDTARGMVSGTDPRLAYNATAAETNTNWVYTTTGGFQIVTSDATVNASGGTYIYLAIA